MKNLKRVELLERLIFGLLLIGMAGAGFIYEYYGEEIQGIVLVPLVAIYLLACYAVYRFLLRRIER